jgi:hypothetical protein
VKIGVLALKLAKAGLRTKKVVGVHNGSASDCDAGGRFLEVTRCTGGGGQCAFTQRLRAGF